MFQFERNIAFAPAVALGCIDPISPANAHNCRIPHAHPHGYEAIVLVSVGFVVAPAPAISDVECSNERRAG